MTTQIVWPASSPGTPLSGMRTCPTCKGTGINPVATYMLCPKCNGETVVAQKK